MFLLITFYFDLCGNTIFCRNKQYFYALTLFHCDYLKLLETESYELKERDWFASVDSV